MCWEDYEIRFLGPVSTHMLPALSNVPPHKPQPIQHCVLELESCTNETWRVCHENRSHTCTVPLLESVYMRWKKKLSPTHRQTQCSWTTWAECSSPTSPSCGSHTAGGASWCQWARWASPPKGAEGSQSGHLWCHRAHLHGNHEMIPALWPLVSMLPGVTL